jgi:hypothetical protein
LGFRTQDKRLAKADFFDLCGGYTMAGNVVNSVFWPDKLMNFHASIVPEDPYPANGTLSSRPYDLHSAQIKKSDDLDNACAKSQVLEALLAQPVVTETARGNIR